MDEALGEAIDRLISVEIRFGSGLPRGVTHRLYEVARSCQGKPLTFLAATHLQQRVHPGDHVLIVTGAGMAPGLPRGETDGPLGAAALARAIDVGLHAKPVLVSEERNLAPYVAAVQAAGLAVDADLFPHRSGCAVAEPFPLGIEAGKHEAARLFQRYQPAAVIFVEKGGPNRAGVFHTILGIQRPPDAMANAHLLADEATASGTLTIGIGDGGNEIGFGLVRDAVQDIQPYGRTCQCPCSEGIATVTATDVLVAAAVSNWGAYGIVAALAAALGDVDVLHDATTEARMLERCVAAGGMDGVYARMIPYVDGTSAAVQTSLITILHEIVGNSFKTVQRGF